MVRSLVLDIDGVLVGEKIGINTPYPHQHVISRLASIRAKGIPVVLCTAKPHYSIIQIIESAHLTNPHITLAGGVVIDPIKDRILESHPFPKQIAKDIIRVCLQHNFYTEVYARDTYYILRSQQYELTKIHTHILQKKPGLVDSFDQMVEKQDVYKILPIVPDESGIKSVNDALVPFKKSTEVTWSLHPIANPHQFCNIAPAGISKRQATYNVLSHLKLDPSQTLAVGDSASDQKFMELTGFVATLENGQDPLKEFVKGKGVNGFIGGHVDDNGILTILDHFHL
ncbi:MAG TPA: HAD hydrolase family protein [Patescibacteria group bacterium]|nr:HAD hydrolase family protein [Patescibacteria group bacterium]